MTTKIPSRDFILRWGIIGCGGIAHDFAKAVAALGGDRHIFTAVAAREKSRAADLASSLPGSPKYFGSYDEMLQEKDVDVVYVSVSNAFHKECVIKCLKASKHVVCEKPMALRTADAQEMIETAKSQGKYLLEGHWSRFFPAYKKLKQIIRDGEFGPPQLIQGSFGFPPLKTFDPKVGGGALTCLGFYFCSAVLDFLSDSNGKAVYPTFVHGKAVINEAGTDDTINISLEFSEIKASFLGTGKTICGNGLNIVGATGGAHMPFIWSPNSVNIYREAASGQILEPFCEPLPVCPESVRISRARAPGFIYQADQVREDIYNGLLESAIVPWQHSITTAKLLEDIAGKAGITYKC